MEVYSLLKSATFSEQKMQKVDLFSSQQLLCGLNCFAPQQSHAPHTHQGVDKIYQVVSGMGEFLLGDEKKCLTAGDVLHVPADVLHGVSNPHAEPLVVMVVMAPNPFA